MELGNLGAASFSVNIYFLRNASFLFVFSLVFFFSRALRNLTCRKFCLMYKFQSRAVESTSNYGRNLGGRKREVFTVSGWKSGHRIQPVGLTKCTHAFMSLFFFPRLFPFSSTPLTDYLLCQSDCGMLICKQQTRTAGLLESRYHHVCCAAEPKTTTPCAHLTKNTALFLFPFLFYFYFD